MSYHSCGWIDLAARYSRSFGLSQRFSSLSFTFFAARSLWMSSTSPVKTEPLIDGTIGIGGPTSRTVRIGFCAAALKSRPDRGARALRVHARAGSRRKRASGLLVDQLVGQSEMAVTQ